MILSLQTFTTMLETMAAGLQGRATQLVDLSVGSVLRALLEACASVALWMQWLILQVLSMTRASTSTGVDLDSWMADFSFTRLPGSASSGLVTFSRFTTGQPVSIPSNTAVLTADGSLRFLLVADAANPAWDNATSSYNVAAESASVTLPVQASMAGTAGNVLAGTIGLLGSALPGIDQVSNASTLAGGVDVESDLSLRSRFQLYVNSRSLGTIDAIGNAVLSLQQGVRYRVLENAYPDGTPGPGNFCVFVDDGGGTASTTFLAAVSAAVEAVRPIGTTFSVMAASLLPVTIQMSIITSDTMSKTATSYAITEAISSWIANLPMGGLVAVSKLEGLAHSVSNSVTTVSTTLVNGTFADLKAGFGAVFELVSLEVSVS